MLPVLLKLLFPPSNVDPLYNTNRYCTVLTSTTLFYTHSFTEDHRKFLLFISIEWELSNVLVLHPGSITVYCLRI